MLPTKGYFQDIECPYYDSSCGRPYCHFRHRKKPTENLEDVTNETEKEEIPAIPTYKPTPKSELANIHNKSHIPISYVPDLAFRPDRKSRQLPKFDKPTYKPTPLSILSSANNRGSSLSEENEEHTEVIREIKQNIANVQYNPAVSLQESVDINFEELSTEFELIDDIINCGDKTQQTVENHIEEVKDKFNETSDVEREITERKQKQYQVKEGLEVEDLHTLSEEEQQEIKKEKFKIISEVASEKHEKNSEKKDRLNDRKFSKTINEKESEKYSEKHEKSSVRKDRLNDKKVSKISSEKDDKLGDRKNRVADKKFVRKSEKEYEKQDRSSEEHNEKSKGRQKESREKTEKSKNTFGNDKKEKYKVLEKVKSHRSREKNSEKEKEKRKETVHKDKIEKNNDSKSHKHSGGDKHRKEEKKDRKEEKHTSHKSKYKKQDKSKERRKSQEQTKEYERQKESDKKYSSKERNKKDSKSRDSKKDKHSDKEHKKSSKRKKKSDRTSDDESDDDSIGNEYIVSPDINEVDFPDSDLDDDDETMLECYKIFNEYKPPERTTIVNEMKQSDDLDISNVSDGNAALVGKKRIAHANIESNVTYSQLHPPTKPKTLNTPGQMLTNRYKLAKLAQANNEQEFIINEVKQPVPLKRPAPSLLEAAREHKIRKQNTQMKVRETTCLVDDIIKGTIKPSISSQQKIIPKKIAPAQNVQLIEKAKERISKIKQTTQIKTVAQSQKTQRVAHVPEVSLSDIPDVLQADKSKLPVNVRTRFLTMIADECVKLYISKQEAFTRALNEEFTCYEKCKVLATYRNSAMLTINRLRKEIQEREKLGLGFINIGEDSEKSSSSQYKGKNFYGRIKKWILSEEELDIHGYPRESEEHHGHAVIKNRKNVNITNFDDNQRKCARCHKIYQVDDDGWPLYEEECLYHPLKKRTIRDEQTYLCCRSNDDTGCATSDTHVSDGSDGAELEGYQTTMEPEYEDDPRSYAVYALDCEMCYTTKGLELTRVTIVDTECKTVYESLVKPLNPIIDYNTRFSGITKEQMEKTSTSILQIQANILHLCNSKTILVGHSLESDMKALKIVHGTIIDTSVLFPHKMGLPHKRALRALASEYLRKIIQNDISGHDSAEDAITCMELIKWKLNDELKVRDKKK